MLIVNLSLVNSYTLNIVYIGLGICFVLLQYDSFLKYSKLSYLVWFLSIIIAAFGVYSDSNTGFLVLFNVFLSIFIAYFFIFKYANLQIYYSLFYFFSLCQILFFLFDIDFGNRNSVSVIFLSLTAIISFIKYKNSDSYPIFLIIITLFFSILYTGRSGIISSLLPFIAILLFSYQVRKLSFIKIILATFFLLLLVVFYNEFVQFITEGFSRLMRKTFTSEDRFFIWSNYMESLTVGVFFTGIDINDLSWLSEFNYNLHSFYLTLHRVFGFLSIVMLYIVLAFLWKVLKSKDFIFASIVLAVLLRISTDSSFRGVAFFVFFLLLHEGLSSTFNRSNYKTFKK